MLELGMVRVGMQSNEIVFVINEQERLQVSLPCALDDIFRYDEIEVEYVKDNLCKYTIYVNDHIIEFMDVLHRVLGKALHGLKKLDKSIKEDLGLCWNQVIDSIQNNENCNADPEWIGQQYLLWSPRCVSSWLYEKDGTIFLEITPTYKWHFQDPKPAEKKEYITYEQFMSDYKPHIITELSVDTIREWLQQTKELLVLIKSNDDRYFIK